MAGGNDKTPPMTLAEAAWSAQFKYAQGVQERQAIRDALTEHCENDAIHGAGEGGGEHPDLAAHALLGIASQASLDALATGVSAVESDLADHLAALDPHPNYALDADLVDHNADTTSVHGIADTSVLLTTAHTAAGDPHTAYQKESEKGQANGYASLDGSGLVPDAQIPSSIARDSELPDLAGHVAAADPHTGYLKENDANWIDLTDGGQTNLHSHAGGGEGGEAFPVGSIFIATVSTNPATLLGYGTWSAYAAGRVLVGIDAGQTEFDTAGETGGAKTHTLQASEMPSHTHTQDAHTHTQNAHAHVENSNNATTGGLRGWGAPDTSTNTETATGYNTGSTTATNQNATATNQNTGGGGAHNNLQPYVVVYMWERTA